MGNFSACFGKASPLGWGRKPHGQFTPTGSDPVRHLRRSLFQLGSQWILPGLPWGLTGFPAPSPGEAGKGRGVQARTRTDSSAHLCMSYQMHRGSSSLPSMRCLLFPCVGTAGWVAKLSGWDSISWAVLVLSGPASSWTAGCHQGKFLLPRALLPISSIFHLPGRTGPARKASRQDVLTSLFAFLLPRVPRRYGKKPPC